LEVPDGSGRPEYAFEAMKFVLKLTPSKTAQLLSSIVDSKEEDPHIELLEQEQVVECLDKDDVQTVLAHLDRCKAQKELAQATRKYLRECAKSTTPTVRKPISFIARETWTPEMAQGLAPPLSKFYRDNWNKRWLCWAGDGPISTRWCRSRSWGPTVDDDKCIEQLLKLLWERHCELTGEDCPLTFPDEKAPAPAAASSSAAKG
jgi:hypothetical protein